MGTRRCLTNCYLVFPYAVFLILEWAGRRILKSKRARVKKKIFVAGGGPAGMEFALVAKQRGHDVTLYEKEERLGGQSESGRRFPREKRVPTVAESLKNRMEISGVRIKSKATLTSKVVEEEHPDVLVVASGARPIEHKCTRNCPATRRQCLGYPKRYGAGYRKASGYRSLEGVLLDAKRHYLWRILGCLSLRLSPFYTTIQRRTLAGFKTPL